MGEGAKQEQAPAAEEKPKAADAKPEEKKTEEGEKKKGEEGEKKTGEEGEKKAEEGKKEEEEPPKPPSPPFVLYVDLHCQGCAKKIERSIMRLRGVEKVTMDISKNQVTIKGVVEPQAVCAKITKKTKRSAKILSPLPAAEGDPLPQVLSSQVSGLTTVELNVNMHCEACAAQLKKQILKMRGVRTAETELSSGKVSVTGTMDADKLVDYVYRRTKKQARIVPQPEPPAPEKEEEKKDPEKPAEETKPPPEEKKEEEKPKEEAKKEEGENKEEKKGGGGGEEENVVNNMNSINEEENMKRMMHHYYHQYQPLYVIERTPAPQLFSDENPNACCIS